MRFETRASSLTNRSRSRELGTSLDFKFSMLMSTTCSNKDWTYRCCIWGMVSSYLSRQGKLTAYKTHLLSLRAAVFRLPICSNVVPSLNPDDLRTDPRQFTALSNFTCPTTTSSVRLKAHKVPCRVVRRTMCLRSNKTWLMYMIGSSSSSSSLIKFTWGVP